MALVFPDPNTFPEFEAPNGITYRWDATDGKWVVGSFSDSDTVKCIGNSSTSETQDCKYRRASDPGAANMIRGDKDGPGQPANFQRLVFGTGVDTSFLKVGGRFDVAKGTEKNYFRATQIEKRSDGKTFVDVTPLDIGSSDFYHDDNLKFTIVDLPGVEADCLQCEDDDVTICEKLETLRLGLIEAEEELESIAPALERGVWLYEQPSGSTPVLRAPSPARYFLLKGYTVGDTFIDPNTVEFTEDYGEAVAVVFNNTEWNIDDENGLGGSTHDWGTVEVGEIIDLFDKPDDDGLFGKITEVTDVHYGPDAILIAFDRIEHLGSPTDNEPYLTRLKIFKEPEGGDAGEFVKKRGDNMSGDLTLDSESDSSTDYDHTQVNAKLTFRNTKTDGTKTYVNLWKNGHGSYLNCDRSFRSNGGYYAGFGEPFAGKSATHGSSSVASKGNLRFTETAGGIFYGSLSSDTDIYRRLYVNNNGLFGFCGANISYMFYLKQATQTGYLTYDGSYENPCAYWGEYNGKKYFSIYNGLRIRTSAGSSNQGTGSAGQVPTADGNGGIYWKTPSTSTTTNYVKTNTTGFNANLTITKSGSTYYITGG